MLIKKCENCGFDYKVKPYRANESRYCSYDCYWNKSSQKSEKECTKCHEILSINNFSKVNRGWSSSCKSCRNSDWKNWYRANRTSSRFIFYKNNAKRNNRDFNLSENQFASLVENNRCFYCHDSNSRLGIDRIDSLKGYVLDNVVPCCRRCNIAKNNASFDDFIRMCHKISKLHAVT